MFLLPKYIIFFYRSPIFQLQVAAENSKVLKKKRFPHSLTPPYQPQMNSCCFFLVCLFLFVDHVWSWYFSLLVKWFISCQKYWSMQLNTIKVIAQLCFKGFKVKMCKWVFCGGLWWCEMKKKEYNRRKHIQMESTLYLKWTT